MPKYTPNISFTKYVEIKTQVNESTALTTRDLGVRCYTTNSLLPTNSYMDFYDLSSVGFYFGDSSAEYARARLNFNYTSKNGKKSKKITFARWADTFTPALIYGARLAHPLSTFQAITDGSITVSLGGSAQIFTGIDSSTITTFADLAALLQTAIRTGTGAHFTTATVVYDSTRHSLNFQSGDVGETTIEILPTLTGTDLRLLIGWGADAIFSDGANAQTLTEVLNVSVKSSDNFGSFLFMPQLTLEQNQEIEAWMSNYNPNVSFIYLLPVLRENAVEWAEELDLAAGFCPTNSTMSDGYPEMLPAVDWSTVDYDGENSVSSAMYLVDDSVTPSVVEDEDALILTQNRVNYYGRTQSGGQSRAFYQDGVLKGDPAQVPVDFNVYANEIWFKSAQLAAFMNMFLTVGNIPATSFGKTRVLAVLQTVITQALTNGVIAKGKTLTLSQRAEVSAITGDPKAFHQIETAGFWTTADIDTYQDGSGATKYKINTLTLYATDNQLRKVEGINILN